MAAEISAGVEMTLRIGQRVRHQDFGGKRVTGVVRGLSVDIERVLMADIVLDTPIVIPARGADDRDVSLWHQHMPAHELVPFDDRDEIIADLLASLRAMVEYHDDVAKAADQRLLDAAYAAIAKAGGGAS